MSNISKAYQVITDRIIELLEKGVIPWRQPWKNGPETRSYTGRSYRGINQLILNSEASIRDLRGCWITYNQVKNAGGSIIKGSRGVPVVLWKWLEEKDDDNELTGKKFPICRYYTVFSICQTEGIDEPTWVNNLDNDVRELDPIEEAESIWNSYQDKPTIEHVGNRAFYRSDVDHIVMPEREKFVNSESYYTTLFHEMSHSTGHPSKLGRFSADAWAIFGSESYSKEELVAEMGANFLASEAGIEIDKILDNSASYINSWIRVLKEQPQMVILAASQAQKAADYIRGVEYANKEVEVTQTKASLRGQSRTGSC